MQKLVWQNSNGDTIDLTSGNYGITNWEGFSNVDSNIQSQRVPMQDGSVFLDALINPRELSVTLKMQDNGNLEERYRMRRELIHTLNPKLGEGYLIYTNDFISKRIKCIAQIPLFPTHNSNNSGTPSASLSWVACDPYWEDLEDTEVNISKFQKPIINNEGDVEIPVKIILNSQDVEKLKVYNQTNGKSIEIQNNTHFQILINTTSGKKSVIGGNVKTELQTINLSLTAKLQKDNVIYFGTQDGFLIKTEDYFKTVSWIKKISNYSIIQIYEYDSKYFICCSEILDYQYGNTQTCEMYVTEDFINFSKQESKGRKILYSELFQKYAVVYQGNRIGFWNDDLTEANVVNFQSYPKMIDICETNEAVYCINSAGDVYRFTDINTYAQIPHSKIDLDSFITCCIGDNDYAYFFSSKKGYAYKHSANPIVLEGAWRAEKDNYYNGVIIDGEKLMYNGSIQISSDNLVNDSYVNYYDEYKYLYTGSVEFSKTRDLRSYSVIKNRRFEIVNNVLYYALGVLNDEIYFSHNGYVYKTKDFKLAELVNIKGVTNEGGGAFNNINKAFITGKDNNGFYMNIFDNNWQYKALSSTSNDNGLRNPVVYSRYLNTLIGVHYYPTYYINVYDKENNEYIHISQKTDVSTVKWICEKENYLYFGNSLYRITCVDMNHMKDDSYKTEIRTNITSNNISGCIYIQSNNCFVAWDTAGNIYRSLNIKDWDTFNITNSQINKCIWCKEYNTLIILTEEDGVYFVNVGTMEKKHIINVETDESFFDGVFYHNKMYLISNIAIYQTDVIFEDNIINKITSDSDLSLNLEKGENLIGYEGSKDFTLNVKYNQKYIGV
jgi:hypothetical protein